MLRDIEGTHRLLFEAHWALVKAGDKVHAAVVRLHEAGRHNEERQKFAEPITLLEQARELIDRAISVTGGGLSKLIHQTGCDGSCSDK